jgi:hypothetical protein
MCIKMDLFSSFWPAKPTTLWIYNTFVSDFWWAYTRVGLYTGGGLIFGGLIVGGLRYCLRTLLKYFNIISLKYTSNISRAYLLEKLLNLYTWMRDPWSWCYITSSSPGLNLYFKRIMFIKLNVSSNRSHFRRYTECFTDPLWCTVIPMVL